MSSIAVQNLDDCTNTRLLIRGVRYNRCVEPEANLILNTTLKRKSGTEHLINTIRGRFRAFSGTDLELKEHNLTYNPLKCCLRYRSSRSTSISCSNFCGGILTRAVTPWPALCDGYGPSFRADRRTVLHVGVAIMPGDGQGDPLAPPTKIFPKSELEAPTLPSGTQVQQPSSN